MTPIKIEIINQTNGKKVTAEVPDDASLRRLIPALVTKLNIPTKQNNRTINYHLYTLEGVQLNEEKSLAGNGINSGTTLQINKELEAEKDKPPASNPPSTEFVNLSLETMEQLANLVASKVESSLLITVREVEELTKAEKKLAQGTMIIRPSFGIPLEMQQYKNDIFMIMPFRDEFESIYRHFIVQIVKSLNLSIKRGDDFFSSHNKSIIEEIWSAIYSSKMVIADCTGRNPNVFYEIGIAHVLGKPTIMITQNIEDVPFDVQSRRLIQYQNNAAGLRELEIKLIKSIQVLLDEKNNN